MAEEKFTKDQKAEMITRFTDHALNGLMARKVTLDTDVLEFLLISGISSRLPPRYKNASYQLEAYLGTAYFYRRLALDTATKLKETEIEGGLILNYEYDRYPCTVGQLVDILREPEPTVLRLSQEPADYLRAVLGKYGFDACERYTLLHFKESSARRQLDPD